MGACLPALCVWLSLAADLQTQFVEVAPPREGRDWVRSPRRERAVILIHGLYPHLFSKANVARAPLHGWQQPAAPLVKRLGQDSDVYSFAYAQTATLDAIADRPDLPRSLERLRQMGYRDIVLLGHSAGGLIARQFVEDYPRSAVTKVIQVCAPNGGSSWAKWQTVRRNQLDFLESLSKGIRRATLSARADKVIPPHVQFACVVGTGVFFGDGLVQCRYQWTTDLQRQGVPVYPFRCTHWFVVRTPRAIDLLAKLVREPQPRWDAARVAAYRRFLIGN